MLGALMWWVRLRRSAEDFPNCPREANHQPRRDTGTTIRRNAGSFLRSVIANRGSALSIGVRSPRNERTSIPAEQGGQGQRAGRFVSLFPSG